MPATTAPNRLQREFTVAQPDQVWVTDHDVGTRCLDDGCLAQAAQEPSAVAESYFSSLKKERIKRHIYASRQDAKSGLFDYIESFYNRVRRHRRLVQLIPLAFEQLRAGR